MPEVRLLIITPRPERFAHWLAELKAACLDVVLLPPDRGELGRAVRDAVPQVVLVDPWDGRVDLQAIRRSLGRLHMGAGIAYVIVAERGQVLAADFEDADDMIDAEASAEEVLFRVRRAALHRPPSSLRLDELELRPDSYEAVVGGTPIALSPLQFALLWCLATQPNRVFSREELARRVWRVAPGDAARRVYTCVHRLRDRLGEYGRRALVVVPGTGYRLVPRSAESPEFGDP